MSLTHLSGSHWSCISLCFVILRPFVDVFYAMGQALADITHPVLWSLLKVDFINVSAPFEPGLFLENPCTTFPVIIIVVHGSAGQPPLRNSDVSMALPLWKSCSDKDEECLPKVDVRKRQTPDCLMHFRVNTTQNVTCLHAYADTTVSCFLYSYERFFCLVFVTCQLNMMSLIRWCEWFNTGCWVYC